jgi:hypothetical protein
MAIDRWDPSRAYAEARAIGMRWFYLALRKQIDNFNAPSNTAELQTAMRNQ